MKYLKDRIEETTIKMRMEKLEMEQKLESTENEGLEKLESNMIKHM